MPGVHTHNQLQAGIMCQACTPTISCKRELCARRAHPQSFVSRHYVPGVHTLPVANMCQACTPTIMCQWGLCAGRAHPQLLLTCQWVIHLCKCQACTSTRVKNSYPGVQRLSMRDYSPSPSRGGATVIAACTWHLPRDSLRTSELLHRLPM